MKKLILIFLMVVSPLIFFSGCTLNPYTETLEGIRNENIDGLITAYEVAFQGMNVDYIETATAQYQKDREKDLLLSGYAIVSKKSQTEIKDMLLFSIQDIKELDNEYRARTIERLATINASFAKFNATVGGAKVNVKRIEERIALLKAQRELAIKRAMTAGVSIIGATALSGTIIP